MTKTEKSTKVELGWNDLRLLVNRKESQCTPIYEYLGSLDKAVEFETKSYNNNKWLGTDPWAVRKVMDLEYGINCTLSFQRKLEVLLRENQLIHDLKLSKGYIVPLDETFYQWLELTQKPWNFDWNFMAWVEKYSNDENPKDHRVFWTTGMNPYILVEYESQLNNLLSSTRNLNHQLEYAEWEQEFNTLDLFLSVALMRLENHLEDCETTRKEKEKRLKK